MTLKLKPRVGVDVDGVLLDLLTPLYEFANKRFNTAYRQEDLSTWSIEEHLLIDDATAFWDDFAAETRGHGALQPLPGAVDGMRRLGDVADVYIVTSYLTNSATWVHDRDAWLARHFGISRKSIVHTHAKHVFSGAMLIDDKADNVRDWVAEHERGRGVLWAHPFNRREHVQYHPRVLRTDSWAEVIHRIQQP